MSDYSENDQPQSPKSGWKKLFDPGPRQKTAISIAVGVVAIALAVNSSFVYESRNAGDDSINHPPPTYTGSQPLSISSTQEALDSNNDWIMVITPCGNQEINQSVTETVVAAGDKIRNTDKIYVGVFVLPADESLDYPELFTRLMTRGDSFIYQVTLRSDITLDNIYDTYLSRKFFRE